MTRVGYSSKHRAVRNEYQRFLVEDAKLTDRQFDMFLMRAAGVGIRTIARSFGVSPATVRDHLEAADRKIERAKGEAA